MAPGNGQIFRYMKGTSKARSNRRRDGIFFVVEHNDPFNTVIGLFEGQSEMVKAK